MDQEPKITPTPEQAPKILSFEEFSNRNLSPKYGNFFLHFTEGFEGNVYRDEEYYKRFMYEHPDMAKLLCYKIQNIQGKQKAPFSWSESLKVVDRELYEAYKIMRGYGASDEDLFS